MGRNGIYFTSLADLYEDRLLPLITLYDGGLLSYALEVPFLNFE